MTAKQFAQAAAIAHNSSIDLSGENIGHFDGYGLNDFQPVFATLRQIAYLIRWQCQYLNGGWDMEEFNQMFPCLKRKVTVIS